MPRARSCKAGQGLWAQLRRRCGPPHTSSGSGELERVVEQAAVATGGEVHNDQAWQRVEHAAARLACTALAGDPRGPYWLAVALRERGLLDEAAALAVEALGGARHAELRHDLLDLATSLLLLRYRPLGWQPSPGMGLCRKRLRQHVEQWWDERCDPPRTYWGLELSPPPDKRATRDCAALRPHRCEVAVDRADDLAIAGRHAEASSAYEGLALNDGSLCEPDRQTGIAAIRHALAAGQKERAAQLRQRYDERYPPPPFLRAPWWAGGVRRLGAR